MKLIWRAYFQLYSKTEHEAYISMDFDRHLEIENAVKNKEYGKAQEILKNDIIFIGGQLFVKNK